MRTSKISWGTVGHMRSFPKKYGFQYPIFTFELDVDELPGLCIGWRLFGFERAALLSVHCADYLEGTGTLREKVEKLLCQHGMPTPPARISLITMPRFCGYIFNPVSFFACFDENEHVVGLLVQVHNTFGETHLYPLVCKAQPVPVTWRFTKDFFVSPFFDREGTYSVVLEAEGKELGVVVDLEKDGAQVFSAYLRGKAQPLSAIRILATLVRFPLTSVLTMARIHLHAMVLYCKVRLLPFEKPEPASRYTIRSRQNLIHKIRLALLSLLRSARG